MLTDRVVLITGAGEGLGKGLAMAASRAGARILVTALSLESAQSVAAEIISRGDQAMAAICDVTAKDHVGAAVDLAVTSFGRLDSIIHNANDSGTAARTIEEIQDPDWDRSVKVALRPIYFSAQCALPHLIASRGNMVVLTSPAGIDGTQGLPIYSAIKAAQRGLVKSLAREWGPHQVRINAVSPSAVTPALEAYFAREPWMRTHIIQRAALRRMGDPEIDIGAVVNFLIGPDSGFVTGQTLVVSGGAMML